MDEVESLGKNTANVVACDVSKLLKTIECKVMENKRAPKECEELQILKEKCCSSNLIISTTAFHGIYKLVQKKILVGSQTVSTLISLMPSVVNYNALVSSVGNILLLELKEQLMKNKTHKCSYITGELEHPFVMLLKCNTNSWFEIYFFIKHILEIHSDIKIKDKLNFVHPVFHYIFHSMELRGSPLQIRLFNILMFKIDEEEVLDYTLKILIWQNLDIHYCLFFQDIIINMLNKRGKTNQLILPALTPFLAEIVKWVLQNGYNPTSWITLLENCLEVDDTAHSMVLFLLSDVLVETPTVYVNMLIEICKSIICSASCSRYAAYKFITVSLNWLISPSLLADSIYEMLSQVISFTEKNLSDWNDKTMRLMNNEYFLKFGIINSSVKFAMHILAITSSWIEKRNKLQWLQNLKESNEQRVQLKLNSFICSIILEEKDKTIIHQCLEILSLLIKHYKDISFSHLCLLFYKLARETDPILQKMFLLYLPKLAVRKDNIPLILGIVESLKKSDSKIMTPLVVILLLSLWKVDDRTYSYLHRILHDASCDDYNLELNLSKAIALREICRLSPHLHSRDVISVLSRVLNECTNHANGLPSAITIEAVTELCKAYVIDVAGTWEAIQPNLSVDKRTKVIIALCKFFGEIPNLNCKSQKTDELIRNIVPMLWTYTFETDPNVVKHAFQALSKFEIENLECRLLPEMYRNNIELCRHNSEDPNSSHDCDSEDGRPLQYVPANCWLQFLEKNDETTLKQSRILMVSIMKRELESLPRGVFYLPPEKSEPLTYSYLPQNSICRILIETLQKYSKSEYSAIPNHVVEILNIISYDYSKFLPPLNWCFMAHFMNGDSKYLPYTLALLIVQGSKSVSAKSLLVNYFTKIRWHEIKLDELVSLYGKLEYLNKIMPYNTIKNFLEETIALCLQSALKTTGKHLQIILENLSKSLNSKNLNAGHKTVIENCLKNILNMIPPDHDIMKCFASCATEFPEHFIEDITTVNSFKRVESTWLKKAIVIRYEFAMRSDIINPMMWVTYLIDAFTSCPEQQNILLNKILLVLRNKRTGNYLTWLQELTWRIQDSIINSESKEMTLYLIDIFQSAVIVLSGYDCLFIDINEILIEKQKKLDIFPCSLSVLLNFPSWVPILPKFSTWLQKISMWKYLSDEIATSIVSALLLLKPMDENGWTSINFILQK